MNEHDAFIQVVDAFGAVAGVELPSGGRGFGGQALKVHGRIFAMCPRDNLVVKLPHVRVSKLIDLGVGVSFDAGKGRPMREWLTVVDGTAATWLQLAREAYVFVAGASERQQDAPSQR